MALIKINNYCLLVVGLITINTLIGCNNGDKLLGKSETLPEWTVVKVSDGDTLTVRDAGDNKIKVRLACIDADETAKPGKPSQSVYAEQAKDYLQELFNQSGDKVNLKIIESDRYNRKVSEIWINSSTGEKQLVNELLVTKGLARTHTRYLSKCPSAQAIKQAEEQAKVQKIGIWSDSSSISPWEFRKKYQNRGS
ncbi:thermonuclease family protein [Iningainema tapete]|uniref:Thermonuclease family protein n=1 Tax=Iningainema tapete BLCC-T55 TaxID=2748662 RepID=A0A8J6XT04_9CYAN|nr:thermonuclease family protein [Iningainema tapete]MBD2778661.1 thermonuclease family protein [Iningainema tapete BLCC-T55]